jgi:hypothetical protein
MARRAGHISSGHTALPMVAGGAWDGQLALFYPQPWPCAQINEGGRRACYPKQLLATRVSNRTDDILGAQAGTMPTRGPRFWCALSPPHAPLELRSANASCLLTCGR